MENCYENDTREKLEADVRSDITQRDSTVMWPPSVNKVTEFVTTDLDTILEWLDRQAAITEREWRGQCASDMCCGFQEVVDINTELQERIAEMEKTHIALPLDADGVLIRPGDMLEDGKVMAVAQDVVVYENMKLNVPCSERHVQPDTVEGILEEWYRRAFLSDDEHDAALVEYAERIRKAVER